MAAPAPATAAPRLLVDAHVHVHPCFRLPAFLDAADSNVRRGAAALGVPADAVGCLLLADVGEEDGLARVVDAVRADAGGWTVRQTDEAGSVILCRGGRPRLLLAAGRQLATGEGLEVLALLTRERLPGRLPLRDAVAAVREAGAVAVIPWGFGKWTLGRGRVVAETLEAAGGPLFLGDTGGRPRLGPAPRLLRAARRTAVPVLPGSDPLPFPDHQNRAGSYGFVADLPLDDRRPASRLRAWLLALAGQPPVYGSRRPLARFARDQLRMQLVKRRRPARR